MRKAVIFSGVLLLFCVLVAGAQDSDRSSSRDCSRIASFAPSITEALFELGLGSAVVGVTRFDNYPGEVRKLPRLGGLLDPSLEALMLVRPSVAMLLREHGELEEKIRALGIRTMRLNHDSVGSVLDSFEEIGRACGKSVAAHSLTERLKVALYGNEHSRKSSSKVRVLVVIGSDSAAEFSSLFVSGRDGFLSELLGLAGAENVYGGSTSGLGSLSPEGLINLNPEVILLIRTIGEGRPGDLEDFKRAWKRFPEIAAVRNDRIHILPGDYMSVPGPRMDRALRDIRNVLGESGQGQHG